MDDAPHAGVPKGDPQDPRNTILDAIERIAGDVPRVLLRDSSDSDASEPSAAHTARARGHYTVLGEIARGGMGVILRSHDADLGRDVAMKVLHEDLSKRADVLQRFVEEAQIGGQLQHPGIVPVYELGLMEDERPFFTMKLVKGRTLSVLLEERSDVRSNFSRLLDIFQSVCQTMAYAHARGVIHRDLKPDNVMVGAFGEVQIVDWGLAKVLARDEPRDEPRAERVSVVETVRSDPTGGSSHSLVGSVMGTPAYMAPEQAAGRVEQLDARSDVFALGAILCEILTGQPPYDGHGGNTVVAAANAHLSDAHERLDGCGADPELVELARACLMPAQVARPANAGALADAIGAYTASVDERARAAQIDAAEARVRAAQRSKALVMTIALAAMVLIAGAGWFWTERQANARRSELAHRIDGELDGASLALSERLFDTALEQARRAAALADSGDPGDEARGRAATFLTRAEAAASAESARVDLLKRNQRLLERLRRLTLDRHALNVGITVSAMRASAYEGAFADYGIDFLGSDAEAVEQALLATGIADQLIDVIDEWSTRERLAGQLERSYALLRIASRLDTDSFRQELRLAKLAEDSSKIVELAQSAEALELTPPTAGALTWSLVELERYDLMLRVLEATQRRHPDDFYMNVGLAMTQLQLREQYPYGPMIYLQAAHAVEPDAPFVLLLLGNLHAAAGNAATSERMYDMAVKGSENDLANLVSTTNGAFESIDPDGAIHALEEILERESELSVGWYELARQSSQRGRLDVAARAYAEFATLESDDAARCNNAAWFLTTVSDETLRDPSLALKAARRANELDPEVGNYWNTRALAEYRSSHFEQALEAAEESIRLNGEPSVYDGWVMVLALVRLERTDSARGLAAEVEGWPSQEVGQRASVLGALRREARELLGGG